MPRTISSILRPFIWFSLYLLLKEFSPLMSVSQVTSYEKFDRGVLRIQPSQFSTPDFGNSRIGKFFESVTIAITN